jgi:hypothetical protein
MGDEALAALTQRMTDLGASEPESWAQSELLEGIAQQARYLVLRKIWRETLSPWRDPQTLRRNATLARLVHEGAGEDLLVEAVRGIVYDAVVTVIGIIDGGFDSEAPDDAPGWSLTETGLDGNLTGRDVGGLHESLLQADPLGREGSDFF